MKDGTMRLRFVAAFLPQLLLSAFVFCDGAAADFNNDGWVDILVPQGAVRNPENSLLYTNNHDGSFRLLTNSTIFDTLANSAACAWGDYDNDGLLDVIISK